ncbi:Hint domain-containing protein [Shimia sagamensis]|uniref:Hint domain-containing protein n=2 Tax=Shimia sagamensis TaxID=1566352 RepID=A0ABY1PIT0_9RHOB|nr:Hint domain-containing protein [Shimia sagamensis]
MQTSYTVQFYCLDPRKGIPPGDFLVPIKMQVSVSENDGTVAAISQDDNDRLLLGMKLTQIFEGDVIGLEAGGIYKEVEGISFVLCSKDGARYLFAPTDGSILQGARFLWSSIKNRSALEQVVIGQITVPSATPGKLIATPSGQKPVTELQKGDQVITRGHGIQEVSWIGHRKICERELQFFPKSVPVLIGQGAMGHGLPERDVLVGSSTRVLLTNRLLKPGHRKPGLLVAARYLTSFAGVSIADCNSFCWTHFNFDRHELVLIDGIWIESFQPNDPSLQGLSNVQRDELFQFFPELRQKQPRASNRCHLNSVKKGALYPFRTD